MSSLTMRWSLWALVVGCLIPAQMRADEELPKSWIDSDTGHQVIRLSSQAGSSSFYFHQHAYSSDGKLLLIDTPSGLSTVDLQSGVERVVVPRGQYRSGGSSGVETGRVTPHVYYVTRVGDRSVLRRTHLQSLETQDLGELPTGGIINGINADETLAIGTQRAGSSAVGEDRIRGSQTARGPMNFFTVNLKTAETNKFHNSDAWLNHMQFSPSDPSLALFCHEGNWHDVDRVWTIRVGSDDAMLMHTRQQQYEIAGHEFFSHDGKWVWYDLQTPRSSQFWLAGVTVDRSQRIAYALERSEWSVHYNISSDGQLFAGDGGGPGSVANHGPLPEKRRMSPAQNGQWIYLFKPEISGSEAQISGSPAKLGKLLSTRLVNLSQHDYSLEPNVTFTPDGRWIVFRSNMHGQRHVYMVSVQAGAVKWPLD